VIALKVHDYFIKYDISLPSNPGGLAVSPDGSTLYATLPSENKVVAVNTTSRSVIGTIDVSDSPQQVIFSPDGKKGLRLKCRLELHLGHRRQRSSRKHRQS